MYSNILTSIYIYLSYFCMSEMLAMLALLIVVNFWLASYKFLFIILKILKYKLWENNLKTLNEAALANVGVYKHDQSHNYLKYVWWKQS